MDEDRLSRDIGANEHLFRQLLSASINADAQFRHFRFGANPVCLIYIEGMADERRISDFALRALVLATGDPPKAISAEYLIENTLEIAQCEVESRVSALVGAVITGMCAMLIDGCDEAVLMETWGYPSRPVNRTTNESVVIGAQEGFVESLRTNMTLLRRYAQSPALITELMNVGTDIPTKICLCYIRDTAPDEDVSEMRRRIKSINASQVQGLGALQQLIEDSSWALLPQMLQTERPDRAASCLMEGQVAVLADNSPCALVAPVTLFHQMHASDDSFARWQYGSFLRVIRMLGMLISLFLPGLYIALTGYHIHLMPLNLLGAIAQARANVPFPVLAEVLMMEFAFYLINEAGTRMPQQIGSALGIVGALILGQAAVTASIISPMLIIIASITGLGSYAIPDYGFSIGLVLCRLFIIAFSALLGLYGFCVAGFSLLLGLCGMRSLGRPYMAPIAPHRPHNPDILLRLPTWMQHGFQRKEHPID